MVYKDAKNTYTDLKASCVLSVGFIEHAEHRRISAVEL